MKVKLDPGAFLTERAHQSDAGLDLRSPICAVVPAHGSAVIDTGLHVALPELTAGLIVSKSGLNVKHDLTSTGLIDAGYTGSIRVKLYNHGDSDYQVRRGDKISQLLILPVIAPELELVSELEPTERGEGGFGSSGR